MCDIRFLSSLARTDRVGLRRLNVDDIPAVLPQLLQSAFSRSALLPTHVERERSIDRGLPSARRLDPKPVRILCLGLLVFDRCHPIPVLPRLLTPCFSSRSFCLRLVTYCSVCPELR